MAKSKTPTLCEWEFAVQNKRQLPFILRNLLREFRELR